MKLKQTLFQACQEIQANQTGTDIPVIHCNEGGNRLAKITAPVTNKYAMALIKRCVQMAKQNVDQTMFENVTNLTAFVSTEGNGSRKRRSLVSSHTPGHNKWLKLARLTANKTGVDTPCWVCSFRPHHSHDNPTSVTVPFKSD